MASFADTMMKGFRSLHVSLYHATNGKIGGSINGSPLVLLTVIGRKTGQPHTMPLACVVHDGEYLVTASAAGADKNPAWFANLQSNPQATMELNGKTLKVKAVFTTGEERDRLYELFKAVGQNFIDYEKKTTRKIPVIRLQPV